MLREDLRSSRAAVVEVQRKQKDKEHQLDQLQSMM